MVKRALWILANLMIVTLPIIPQPGSNHTSCITTFVFQRGYVSSVDYENKNGGLIGQSIPECLKTVGPCLPEE